MLSGLGILAIALLTIAGAALDMMLGETRRWHPLVGFGSVASRLERRLNPHSSDSVKQTQTPRHMTILRGTLAWMLAVLPPVLAVVLILQVLPTIAALAVHAILLYLCLGLRSLRDHTVPIAQALADGELAAARNLTSRIVSRDTDNASPADLSKAAVESLLENGNDAVFGTLFWFAIAGAPGAVLFRLANTLDAMWGYRSTRYNLFGRVAARIDDLLNWIPARLTAVSYATLGHTQLAFRCWRTQAAAWPSPNAGPVMSAGAGTLGLALGGAATYDGVSEIRPPLGSGTVATFTDIRRAWQLVLRTTLLWLAILLVWAVIFTQKG
ncbi:adenosylcobinamide-phosphate synthase CbiB [Glaciimonas immobilis]|uniref:Cobalamin biosynthesis protein CobD n=1 Tax=Glaciimonas immobilis TaxID=728004 RepID=A0A840RQ89_9BURK|nr:adenosylcobinamide-phosphate synthase CbiB [Glaciimonas immobilis]KAF3997062.1 cobalamin biosynthesis protein [Glaciimonas immobilis]MBB5199915.1 adenosylcobinamide-phosphate synthase [Glaciimonas immobilis]